MRYSILITDKEGKIMDMFHHNTNSNGRQCSLLFRGNLCHHDRFMTTQIEGFPHSSRNQGTHDPVGMCTSKALQFATQAASVNPEWMSGTLAHFFDVLGGGGKYSCGEVAFGLRLASGSGDFPERTSPTTLSTKPGLIGLLGRSGLLIAYVGDVDVLGELK